MSVYIYIYIYIYVIYMCVHIYTCVHIHTGLGDAGRATRPFLDSRAILFGPTVVFLEDWPARASPRIILFDSGPVTRPIPAEKNAFNARLEHPPLQNVVLHARGTRKIPLPFPPAAVLPPAASTARVAARPIGSRWPENVEMGTPASPGSNKNDLFSHRSSPRPNSF